MKIDEKIMVLDGYSTRTLACVRSFGRSNIPFSVGGHTHFDMSLLSRYAREKFIYTSPFKNISQFFTDITYYINKFKTNMLLPTSEAAILALSKFRGQLGDRLLMPSDEQIDFFLKKYNTIKSVEKVGVRVPKTHLLTINNIKKLDPDELGYPLILKPNESTILTDSHVISTGKFLFIRNKNDFLRKIDNYLHNNHSVLVQSYIKGAGYGISGIFREGIPVVLFAHRRLHESNPMGGPSALAVSQSVPSEHAAMVRRIMEPTKLTGPAMLEFKIDSEMKPVFMEINGRFWGSVLLPLKAGLDLPLILLKTIFQENLSEPDKSYKINLNGRYLVGDTKWLYLTMKGKPDHWPVPFEKRMNALKIYAKSFFDRSTFNLVLDPDDPLPFIGRIIQEVI